MHEIFGAIIIAVLAFIIGRFVARKGFMSRRKILDDNELIDLFASSDLAPSMILVILRTIGKYYGIPYGVLRPDDCFNGNLWNLDQMKMGCGTKRFNTYLSKNFGLRIKMFQIRFRPISIDGLLRQLAAEGNAIRKL